MTEAAYLADHLNERDDALVGGLDHDRETLSEFGVNFLLVLGASFIAEMGCAALSRGRLRGVLSLNFSHYDRIWDDIRYS